MEPPLKLIEPNIVNTASLNAFHHLTKMGWKKVFTKPISAIKRVFRSGSCNAQKLVSKENVILLYFIQFEFDDPFDMASPPNFLPPRRSIKKIRTTSTMMTIQESNQHLVYGFLLVSK